MPDTPIAPDGSQCCTLCGRPLPDGLGPWRHALRTPLGTLLLVQELLRDNARLAGGDAELQRESMELCETGMAQIERIAQLLAMPEDTSGWIAPPPSIPPPLSRRASPRRRADTTSGPAPGA